VSARDKVIIVTGAARNMGFHTAAALVRRGAKVAIMGRNAASLVDAVAKLGTDTFGVCAELSTGDAVERALEKVAAHFGGIDGIVNNAGVAYPNRVEALNDAQIVEQITINLLAPILTCRAVIPYLRKRGGGRIVNVSSATVHVEDAFAHLSIYAATKAGLERFTKELRFEVQQDNIAVTTFIPGDTDTPFGAGWDAARVQAAYADWMLQGPYWNGAMPVEAVGEEIAHCFDLPAGVAYEFAMLRPVGRANKALVE
jgi:3-oxoacyl-[acyl-carrier protein] reductase